MRRTRFDIIEAILLAIKKKGGMNNKTDIMYEARMSWSMINEYLGFMLKKSLIEEVGKLFKITANGEKFLEKFQELKQVSP